MGGIIGALVEKMAIAAVEQVELALGRKLHVESAHIRKTPVIDAEIIMGALVTACMHREGRQAVVR